MAKVTVKEKVVKTVEGITLDLSLEEAQVLFDIYWFGSMGDNNGKRKHFTAIGEALRETKTLNEKRTGKLYFTGHIDFAKE